MSRSLYGQLLRRFRPQQFRDGISRREALKAALAAGAGLLLSSRFGTPLLRADDAPASPGGAAVKPNGKRVAIVGAGFGGLACAYELKSAGYHVTVLEARNRVGGRVLSLSDVVKDKNVEGGAEFIGSNHPCWVNYAKQFGLEFLDVSDDGDNAQPLVLGGKRIDDKEAKELLEEMEKIFNLMNEDAKKVNEDEPWLTEKAAEWDKKTTADWLAGVEGSALAKAAAKAELEGNNTVALALQSYLGNLTQVKGGGVEKYWTDTEVYRCKGGNQQLAMKLAKAVGLDSVNLGVAVRRIVVKENGVTLTADDNRVVEADDVVLAVPPSTWGKISIEPALPEALSPQMGKGTKYLAALKKNFWKDTKQAADGHSDGDVSLTWDGTDAQPGEEDGACLVVFSGGPAAEKTLAYPKDVAQRDARFTEEVSKLYADYAKNFVSAKFMDWPNDPLTLASYSFPAPGQIMAQGKILREGLGRLHFAGEAASYKFVGYMEGGLNSGASLAQRLAKRDGIVRPDAPDPTKLPPPPPEKPGEKADEKPVGQPKAGPQKVEEKKDGK